MKNQNPSLPILIFFGAFLILGIIVIAFSQTPSWSTSVIWMLACAITGSSVGFLFAIPKIQQDESADGGEIDNPPKNRFYRMLINTNLTEISDWLTKIIVGLGLVNLTKIPPLIKALGLSFATGISPENPESALAFAFGIIFCYTILGFLFGYIYTRMELSLLFFKADQGVFTKLIRQVEETQREQIKFRDEFLESQKQLRSELGESHEIMKKIFIESQIEKNMLAEKK